MPIKGTIPLEHIADFKETWKKLISDKKNESELFMIIDLLRNDLARIEFPRAKVVKKKLPLIVPGLLHQYAKIEVELTEAVTIKIILEKMFPGGSITGAPKKSAIKILHQLENRERKFYCGSTLICFKDMKAASINIRSAEINFKNKNLTYQSGGGITLKSTAQEEYKEMIAKRESFIRAL
jgi:anthranilate/para-aminobenzoate synthase component I